MYYHQMQAHSRGIARPSSETEHTPKQQRRKETMLFHEVVLQHPEPLASPPTLLDLPPSHTNTLLLTPAKNWVWTPGNGVFLLVTVPQRPQGYGFKFNSNFKFPLPPRRGSHGHRDSDGAASHGVPQAPWPGPPGRPGLRSHWQPQKSQGSLFSIGPGPGPWPGSRH